MRSQVLRWSVRIGSCMNENASEASKGTRWRININKKRVTWQMKLWSGAKSQLVTRGFQSLLKTVRQTSCHYRFADFTLFSLWNKHFLDENWGLNDDQQATLMTSWLSEIHTSNQQSSNSFSSLTRVSFELKRTKFLTISLSSDFLHSVDHFSPSPLFHGPLKAFWPCFPELGSSVMVVLPCSLVSMATVISISFLADDDAVG